MTTGETTWGHITGVTEINVRTFTGNWTGTASIEGGGDGERIEFDYGEYSESEIVETGASKFVEISTDAYNSSDVIPIYTRTGATSEACAAATYELYTSPILSLGYVQIKISKATWYLSGGIPAANCIMAYQPKGAANLTASYTNLANPGTYTLAPGNAPTFDSATGWTFDGSNNILLIATGAVLKPFTFIARITPSGAGTVRSIIGGGGVAVDVRIESTNKMCIRVYLTNLAESNTAITSEKTIAASYSATGQYAYYLDGVADGSGTDNQTVSASTGAIGSASTDLLLPFNGVVAALSIYNTVLTSTQVASLVTAVNSL